MLELVHSDMCKLMRTTSIGGGRFFLTFIDDFSREMWVYVLKSKREVFEKFVDWKALVERQSEHKIKVFKSDNGREYTSKRFDEFLHIHGINRHTSAPYTPQQNGVAECANRTIVEMARSMIHSKGLGKQFWAEAVCNAAYTCNWCPTTVVYGMTPEEAWSGKKPSISHLCVFGCIAYARVPDEKRSKLDAKGIKCLMLGYCEGTRAYRLMCLETKKIIKSPDVTFFEDMEDLEKCPSGRNEGSDHMVDSFPKSNQEEGIVDDLEDDEEQEEDLGDGEKHVEAPSAPSGSLKASKAKEVAPKPPQPTSSTQEDHQTLQESRYSSRVRKPLGELWMNHIQISPKCKRTSKCGIH